MKRIINVLLVAWVLSLVPATNVIGQSKRVKPPKRSKVVKEDTRLRTEAEIKEQKTRIAVPETNASSDDADATVLKPVRRPTTKKKDDKIYEVCDERPKFSEGNPVQWASQHVVYPAEAAGSGIEGRVVVEFVVERDGSLSQVKVVRSLGPLFDKEAVRVVKSMPKWTPGGNYDRDIGYMYGNVRCRFTMPVVFKKP